MRESGGFVPSSTTMNVMSTTPRRRLDRSHCTRALAAAVLSALLAAACTQGDDDAASGPTTVPAATTLAPRDPLPDDTAAVTEATQPATTPPPTEAPTITTTTSPPAPTTTTEPLAVQELILSTDGFGSARFGAEPEGVISYVTSILGGNTADTGWVAPDTFAVCLGTVARKVDWGVLTLLFTDESSFATGRRHLIGYEYGRVGEIGDEPVGLRTSGGVTLGSRVVDLLAEFPEAAVNEGEIGINIPDNFYVSDVFYGLLTGIAQDDVVTVIFGGDGCGE